MPREPPVTSATLPVNVFVCWDVTNAAASSWTADYASLTVFVEIMLSMAVRPHVCAAVAGRSQA